MSIGSIGKRHLYLMIVIIMRRTGNSNIVDGDAKVTIATILIMAKE